MARLLPCPSCGKTAIDVRDYRSMMVLRRDFALFSLTCPSCGAALSTLQPIPSELREEIRCAALAVGAGMGRN